MLFGCSVLFSPVDVCHIPFGDASTLGSVLSETSPDVSILSDLYVSKYILENAEIKKKKTPKKIQIEQQGLTTLRW